MLPNLQASLFVFLLIVVSLAIGCGERERGPSDVQTSTHQQVVSECKAEQPYSHCAEIDLTKVEFWQDTVKKGDPVWRTIDRADSGADYAYIVTIDADLLNGGVIPTHPDQGHYADDAEYAQVVEALLGVPLDDKALLVVNGTTLKVDSNLDYVDGTTGSFLFDALSDDRGRIVVDGDDITRQEISAMDFHDFEVVIDEHSSTADDTDGVTQASTTDVITGTQGWTADQEAYYSTSIIYHRLGGRINNVALHGNTCRWTKKFWRFFRECNKARLTVDLGDGERRIKYDRSLT